MADFDWEFIKKHKLPFAIGGVAFFFLVLYLVNGGSSSGTGASAPGPTGPTNNQTAIDLAQIQQGAATSQAHQQLVALENQNKTNLQAQEQQIKNNTSLTKTEIAAQLKALQENNSEANTYLQEEFSGAGNILAQELAGQQNLLNTQYTDYGNLLNNPTISQYFGSQEQYNASQLNDEFWLEREAQMGEGNALQDYYGYLNNIGGNQQGLFGGGILGGILGSLF